jgi:hypothetical protein
MIGLKTVCLTLVVFWGACSLNSSAQPSGPVCLATEPGDSRSFGYALAIDKNYLAVGDPEANRVVLYHRGSEGEWSRVQELLPPDGSEAAEAGVGFGHALDLSDGTLVIGAYRELLNNDSKSPSHKAKYVGGIFTIDLGDQLGLSLIDSQVKSIPINALLTNTSFEDARHGFEVSIDGSLMAFGISKDIESPSSGVFSGKGAIGLLRKETSWQELEIITPPKAKTPMNLGGSTDVANNLLVAVVAYPETDKGTVLVKRSAYLYDLNDRSGWQRLLKDENPPLNGWFGGHVALSSNLALLGGVSGSPLETSSAVVTMSGSTASSVRYVFPGGRGAVYKDFAIVEVARPTPLSPPPIPPDYRDEPTLSIVDQTGVRPVTLKEPQTGNTIDSLQALAVNEDFVVLAQKKSNPDCKVFIVPRTFFNHVFQS